MPIGGIERCISGPSDRICLSGRILVFEDWSGLASIDRAKGTDIGIEGMSLVYIEVTSINFIHAIARIEICQWCDARTDPTNSLCVGSVEGSTVVGIVDHKLIFVGMAKEYSSNNVRGISIDDLVEKICGQA